MQLENGGVVGMPTAFHSPTYRPRPEVPSLVSPFNVWARARARESEVPKKQFDGLL